MASFTLDFEGTGLIGGTSDGSFDSVNEPGTTDVDRTTASKYAGTYGTSYDKTNIGQENNFPKGIINAANCPTWSSTTDFWIGFMVHPNAVDSSGSAYRVKVARFVNDDINFQLRFSTATSHDMRLVVSGMTTSGNYILTSNDWNEIYVWLEYEGVTPGKYHIHFYVNGVRQYHATNVTYSGSYSQDMQFGATADVGAGQLLDGLFYMDEIHVNNTGTNYFSTEDPVENSVIVDTESITPVETSPIIDTESIVPVEASPVIDTESIIPVETSSNVDTESILAVETSQVIDTENITPVEASHIIDTENQGIISSVTVIDVENIGTISSVVVVDTENVSPVESSRIIDIESLQNIEGITVIDTESTGTGSNAVEKSVVIDTESVIQIAKDSLPHTLLDHEFGSLLTNYINQTISNGGNVEISSDHANSGTKSLKITPSGGGHDQFVSFGASARTVHKRTIKCAIKMDTFTILSGDYNKNFDLLRGSDGSGRVEGIQYRQTGSSTRQIRAFLREENGSYDYAGWLTLVPGWNNVRVTFISADPLIDNGSLRLDIDGADDQNFSMAYRMINYKPTQYQIGISTDVDSFSGESGSFYVDDIEVLSHTTHGTESVIAVETSPVIDTESIIQVETSKVVDVEHLVSVFDEMGIDLESVISVEKLQTIDTENFNEVLNQIAMELDVKVAKNLALDIFVK